MDDLKKQVDDLEQLVAAQQTKQASDLRSLEGEVQAIRELANKVDKRSPKSTYVRRVEWTIPKFEEAKEKYAQGTSMFSPKFAAAGMEDVNLELFPCGREKTSPGFCSLFLWCPSGMAVKYQLFVGSFLHAPSLESYEGDIGHGYSNFCRIEPEVIEDKVVVGVIFHEVDEIRPLETDNLKLIHRPIQAMVDKEVSILTNSSVNQVVWKIYHMKQVQQLPRGHAMYSKLFTAAGVRDNVMQFYPNGTDGSKKDGHCSFYFKATPGSALVITLFVGKVRKGPIKTTFEDAFKGLPDFCDLAEQINQEDDSLEVGIELKHEKSGTLHIES